MGKVLNCLKKFKLIRPILHPYFYSHGYNYLHLLEPGVFHPLVLDFCDVVCVGNVCVFLPYAALAHRLFVQQVAQAFVVYRLPVVSAVRLMLDHF